MLDLTKCDGHTKGPWVCDEMGVYADGHCIFDYDSNVDQEADMHLIALAPTLKEEVLRLYSEIQRLKKDLEDGSYSISLTKRLEHILRNT